MSNTKKQLADKLNHLLRINNLDQADLARMTGLSHTAISNYINGIAIPTSENLSKIANALNVSTDYLLGFTQYETPQFAAHNIADELHLSSEALTGLLNNIQWFQELSGSVSCEDTQKFINEFLKSPALSMLLTSAFMKCLKQDQVFVLNSIPTAEQTKMSLLLNYYEGNLAASIKSKNKELSFSPEEIIDDFCKKFSSFIPADEQEKLSSATSLTTTASVLRHSKSEVVRNHFTKAVELITIYNKGQFKEFMSEFLTEFFKSFLEEE